MDEGAIPWIWNRRWWNNFCFLLRLSTSNTLTLQLLTLIQSYTIYLRLLTLASTPLILQYFRLVPLVGWRAEERDV